MPLTVAPFLQHKSTHTHSRNQPHLHLLTVSQIHFAHTTTACSTTHSPSGMDGDGGVVAGRSHDRWLLARAGDGRACCGDDRPACGYRMYVCCGSTNRHDPQVRHPVYSQRSHKPSIMSVRQPQALTRTDTHKLLIMSIRQCHSEMHSRALCDSLPHDLPGRCHFHDQRPIGQLPRHNVRFELGGKFNLFLCRQQYSYSLS